MYKFIGQHLMMSLYGVKQIEDREFLKEVFENAIEMSGATICAYNEHVFSDGGMTGAFLLKESHCTFHTYINQKNIFVDFFTCGNSADFKKFENVILCRLEMDRSQSNVVRRK